MTVTKSFDQLEQQREHQRRERRAFDERRRQNHRAADVGRCFGLPGGRGDRPAARSIGRHPRRDDSDGGAHRRRDARGAGVRAAVQADQMTLLLSFIQHEAERVASPFDINGGVIIWTVVIFVILLAVLYRLGYPALLRMVEERERRIQKQLDDAEKANAEAQRLLEEHKKQIAAARNEAQDILAKAKAVSQKERETLLAKAREEYDALLSRARKDIDAEKEKAILALRREAVDLSIAAASRVIEANLDTEANRKLVTEFLESLGKAEKQR